MVTTMRIIISPAKKMVADADSLDYIQKPIFINEAEHLLTFLRNQTFETLKEIWNCSEKLARLNHGRLLEMDLNQELTPALLAYEGLQYQYMAPGVFTNQEFEYLESHLRILSGFYGLLRPFDGVTPYRLEMQTKLSLPEYDDLYAFWGEKLADQLQSESSIILNLASKEYSKVIEKHLDKDTRFVTCLFGEKTPKGLVEKGTLAKMARGEMVRFMAEDQIKKVEDIRQFNRLGYFFSEEYSEKDLFVFIKKNASVK